MGSLQLRTAIFTLLLCVSIVRGNEDNEDKPKRERIRRAIRDNAFQYRKLSDDGSWAIKDCPHALTQQMVFDPVETKCVPGNEHHIRTKRQATTTGYPCFESIDCVASGMYCDSTKRCACLSTFTELSGVCYQKINPDQPGCQNYQQCTAVWPGAFCSNGVCKCANSATAWYTNDGPICLNYGTCPVGGEAAKLRAQADYSITQCQAGQDQSCGFSTHECICSTPDCGVLSDANTVFFCCPVRSFACTLQADSGSIPTVAGGGNIRRYFYNSVTGNCEQFTYAGIGGNANNFETKDFCESYCKTSCPRGPPQYDGLGTQGSQFPKSSPLYCNTGSTSSSSSCDSNHQCTTVGTYSLCCAKPSFICGTTGSYSGGVLYGSSSSVFSNGYDVGKAIASNAVTYPRYYYDTVTTSCRPFTWLGQTGNWNNFLTKDACDSYCSQVLCTAGNPLQDSSGLLPLYCSGGSVCPSSHDCTNNVCCPKKQTVCSLGKAVGTCGNYVDRWWYNAQTRNCELFTYSGCQGNSNNFATYTDCQNFCKDATLQPTCILGKALKDSSGNYYVCSGTSSTTTSCPANYDCYFDGTTYGCCPTQAYTCSLSYDQGTSCGPPVNRWYFNPSTRTCISFQYYGCDGNSNNFATQQDCLDGCGVGGCPDGGSPFTEASGTYRVCAGGSACPFTHYCTQVTLGTAVTYNYCCPSRTYVCGLSRDVGARCSSTTLTRYFFNSVSRNCESFSYGGCGGNRNNFQTSAQCLNYCNSAGCPSGTIALQDPTSSVLQTCAVGSASSCPSGYNCLFSSLLNQNICCGAPGSGDRCPAGQSTYINPFFIRPLQCTPNVLLNCPANYICWYSVTQNSYYCCGSATTQCPQGGSVYVLPGTNIAQQCTPGVSGACPTQFVCQATSLNIANVQSTTGYCCGSSGACPNNGQAQLVNNVPVTCQSGSNACQLPYSCQFSSSMGQSYCCTTGTVTTTAVCGASSPYIVNNYPVVCTTGSASTNCPAPYSCQLYAPTNNYYCCQTGIVSIPTIAPSAGGCPPGLTPFLVNNQPGQYQFCSPNTPNSCNVGYFCQYDSVMFRYYCCGRGGVVQPAVCPSGVTATQACTGGAACPFGQTCTSLSTGQFCCSSPVVAATCPNNAQAFINPFTNQPQNCIPNVIQCPANFVCTPSAGGQYYCCAGSVPTPTPQSGCPNNAAVAYISGTNSPQTCQPQGFNVCPSGYSCQFSSVYSRYQCCQGGAITGGDQYGCPQGNSYLYPGTQIPLACQQFGASCPVSYQCLQSTRYSGFQCCGSGAVATQQQIVQPVFNQGVRLGDFGCSSDSQCQNLGGIFARCTNGRCLCSSNLLVYVVGNQGSCVQNCPFPYINNRGVCQIASGRQRYKRGSPCRVKNATKYFLDC